MLRPNIGPPGRRSDGFWSSPSSPPVQQTSTVCTPSAWYVATVAAPLDASSSGWACTVSSVSGVCTKANIPLRPDAVRRRPILSYAHRSCDGVGSGSSAPASPSWSARWCWCRATPTTAGRCGRRRRTRSGCSRAPLRARRRRRCRSSPRSPSAPPSQGATLTSVAPTSTVPSPPAGPTRPDASAVDAGAAALAISTTATPTTVVGALADLAASRCGVRRAIRLGERPEPRLHVRRGGSQPAAHLDGATSRRGRAGRRRRRSRRHAIRRRSVRALPRRRPAGEPGDGRRQQPVAARPGGHQLRRDRRLDRRRVRPRRTAHLRVHAVRPRPGHRAPRPTPRPSDQLDAIRAAAIGAVTVTATYERPTSTTASS